MKCTHSFPPPACLRILWFENFGRNTKVRVIFTNNCQVFFGRSYHPSILKKFNSPLLLFLDFITRIQDQLLCLLYCCLQKNLVGHFCRFEERCWSDHSRCSRHACYAIVTDMMETFKIIVTSPENEIRQFP